MESKDSQLSDSAFRPAFPRPASASHLPLDKQFRAAAVAAANAAAQNEPTVCDALDDEIRQITMGQEPSTNLEVASEMLKHQDDFGFSLSDNDDGNYPQDGETQENDDDKIVSSMQKSATLESTKLSSQSDAQTSST